MIIPKIPYGTRKDGVKLYLTKSDAGFYIRKIGTNEIYDEAIDVENAPFKYEETDKKIKNQLENQIEPIEEHEV